MKKTLFSIMMSVFMCLILVGKSFAIEIQVQGEAKSLINGDKQTLQYITQKKSVENAIKIAIDKILGANASNNPDIKQKIEEIAKQLNTYVVNSTYQAQIEKTPEGKFYAVNTNLVLDDTKLRQLISDMGIAINTGKVRLKSIVTVMDEYFTYPTNMVVPLKEYTVYSKTSSSAYTNKLNSSNSNHSSAMNSNNGFASDNSHYNVNNNHNASFNNSNNSNYGQFVNASGNDREFFAHVKVFQPKVLAPEKVNYTQGELQSAFQNYDLKVIDNAMIKNRYFKNKPISVVTLENTAEINNYANFARKNAKAEFFAIGTTVITDNGYNHNVGGYVCDGMTTIRVYSTFDGEAIASGTLTASAVGNSPDQGRAAVAKKIGGELGTTLSAKIQDYWKKRQMYGSEFTVSFTGNFKPIERIQLINYIRKLNGVSNVEQRDGNPGELEYSISYKGEEALGDSLFMELSTSPLSWLFQKYDYKVYGNRIKFAPIVAERL